MVVEVSFWEAHGSLTAGPCPHCSAMYRYPSRNDPRGALSIVQDRWHCFECSASGMVSDLGGAPTKEQRMLASMPRVEMPEGKCNRFWNYCTTISEGSDVKEYLDGRFGRSDYTVSPDLARRLPDFAYETDPIKGWKRSRRHLIVPLLADGGRIANFVGRSIGSAKIKSMALKGCASSGLAMFRPNDGPVVITEGELDFLAWAIFVPDAYVIGVRSGSAKHPVFARLRNRRVVFATDLDEAGDKYAADIRSRMHRNLKTERWDPGMDKVVDACDVLKKGGELKL